MISYFIFYKSKNMKVVIASDHAGYSLRMKIIQNLRLVGGKYQVKDLGTNSLASCDFPDYAKSLCEFMEQNTDYLGILVCGSGIGMSMAANRYKHIRCALCRSSDDAIIAREHNNANVIALGERFTGELVAMNIVPAFLNTEFLEKHYQKRMDMIS